MTFVRPLALPLLATALLTHTAAVDAHKLREKNVVVAVADSPLTVTPSIDWNRLSGDSGKNTETWTLDGEQLNDVTFFAGIEAGKPLVKERSKKKDPLPKFRKATLLPEVPELLEGTYHAYKKIGSFKVTVSEPTTFLGTAGIHFTFEFTDADLLPRKGDARAAIIDGKLFMMTFDAPRLYYYDHGIAAFRALADTAKRSSAMAHRIETRAN